MKFTFYWRTGQKDILEGDTPTQALNNAGYGGGAVRALDFFSFSKDADKYVWNAEERNWKLNQDAVALNCT